MGKQKIILTGVTGILGKALYKELEERYEVYYIVRKGVLNNRLPADMNIRNIFVGDIIERLCGLSEKNLQLLSDIGIDKFLHVGANVSFGVNENEDEIWVPNYYGTKNALELSKYLGVKEFHHCSTAFSNEQRNPYENSKKSSEDLVKNSGLDFAIYKPSVIVGDSKDGHISSFNAFYSGLAFLLRVLNKFDKDFSVNLVCDKTSTLNFIQVDWLTYAILGLFDKPANNDTYYLTHHNPCSARWILEKSFEILNIKGITFITERSFFDKKVMYKFDCNSRGERIQRMADAGCKRFLPYLTHERFSSLGNVKTVLGDAFLYPPPITGDYLELIINYAVRNNFGVDKRFASNCL